MKPCALGETADVELYFYGELDPVEHARVERHLRGCEPCRQRLDDLHAIRQALAARPLVDAPPAGDWSGFTRRLDVRLREGSGGTGVEPTHRNLESAGAVREPFTATADPWNLRNLLALAAMLALVTIGVLVAMRVKPAVEPSVAVNPPVAEAVTAKAGAGDRALREGSAELLERSKLVVLGLATRDPRARGEDWQDERQLAGTLLSDTRLYRQAAYQGGAADVERVMRDLETVLLETSMSDRKDPASLERIQRLIARRDLVVKMQVMAAAGPAGN